MNKAKPSRGFKLMTYNVIRKTNGATREDSSIFFIYKNSTFAKWFKYGLRASAPQVVCGIFAKLQSFNIIIVFFFMPCLVKS